MNWTKISETEFHLKQGETLLAGMKLQDGVVECSIDEQTFQIRRKGFWGNQIELTDSDEQTLALVKPLNWHGFSAAFTLYGQHYQLLVRNNPLAEYVIQQDGRDVVAYGLKTHQGRAIAVITDNRREQLRELDLLLWYLFGPVAQSETGDAATTDMMPLLATA